MALVYAHKLNIFATCREKEEKFNEISLPLCLMKRLQYIMKRY